MKFGCKRGLPDPRDWHIETHPAVAEMLYKRSVFGRMLTNAWAAPKDRSVDLRDYCSPIEDQGDLGSCTAQAVVGMAEFLERRAYGHHVDASRLFVYKATRNLEGDVGDTGAYIRTAMKSLVVFGAPPERYWPYDIADFDKEPPAFCYAYGQSFQALRYFRIDGERKSPAKVLSTMKAVLRAELPIIVGFVVFDYGDLAGRFVVPTDEDMPLGGHAVMACGYDDTNEAFLIRNSWGTDWGDDGYGWLPYEYVLEGYAWDIWTMFKKEYLDERRFA